MGGGGGTTAPVNPFGTLPGSSAVMGELASTLQPFQQIAQSGLESLNGVGPAQFAYPYAQGTALNILNNPFAGGAIQGGQTAADLFSNQITPLTFSTAPSLTGLGSLAAGQAPNIPGLTYANPNYGNASNLGQSILTPQFAQDVPGALDIAFDPQLKEASDLGAIGAPQLYNLGIEAANFGINNPYLGNAVGQGSALGTLGEGGATNALNMAFNNPAIARALQFGTDTAGKLGNLADQISTTAFDPQQALYDRTQQQIRDQTNAALATSGVANTPYGAGITADTLKNFNIDWQNRQLSREVQGGGAAGSLYGQGLSQLVNSAAEQIANMQAGTGAFGNLANTAEALFTQPSLAELEGQRLGGSTGSSLIGGGLSALTQGPLARASALGTGTQAAEGLGGAALGSLLDPAKAETAAALGGTSALGNLINTAGGAYGGALGQLGSLASGATQFLPAPYNLYNAIQGNNFTGLGNFSQLGSTIFGAPQNVASDFLQYLGLGPNAASAANQAASINAQTQMAQAQGIGQLAGLGTNLIGGGGGLGGLFGGGAGAAAPFVSSLGAAPAGSMFEALASGGATAADVGAGADAGFLLPLAAGS